MEHLLQMLQCNKASDSINSNLRELARKNLLTGLLMFGFRMVKLTNENFAT